MSGGDDLLEQARQRLKELDEQGDGGELGDRIVLAESESFVGRWRGEGPMRTKDGETISVYLLWGPSGQLHFHYKNARLTWEIEELKPRVGDEIAIVRGTDIPGSGDRNPTQRYAVRIRPCDDPLPGEPTQTAFQPTGQLAADDDLPF